MTTAHQPPGERPSKVAKRRSRVRRDLAREAIALMAAKGYDATTVEDIARAADYHASSFFRYFKAKEDAVFVGIPEATAEFRRECQAIDCPAHETWAAVRVALVRAVARFTEEDPEFFDPQFALWVSDPALRAPLTRRFQEWEEIITDAFPPRVAGTRADLYVHVLGGAVISTLRAAVQCGDLGGATFAERVDQACGILDAGLGRESAVSWPREGKTSSDSSPSRRRRR